jgi:hypothetical protein
VCTDVARDAALPAAEEVKQLKDVDIEKSLPIMAVFPERE